MRALISILRFCPLFSTYELLSWLVTVFTKIIIKFQLYPLDTPIVKSTSFVVRMLRMIYEVSNMISLSSQKR